MLRAFGHSVAMCCNMLSAVGSLLKHVAPNNVAICCVDLLRSFGQGFKSPGQTIATRQHNISQHCWAQHVVCVWPPCCDMLGVVGSSLKIVKLEPTTPNMSQHVATWWPNARNMLRPTMLRCVALACCDRLAGALDYFQT